MSNVLTILKRELRAYFCGPVGYIYLVAFLLLTNVLGLFSPINPFFFFPVADLRTYFHILAGVSTIFVTAITMRLWAEERKENTFEMLLTFPMRPSELVLGKFLASLAFYVLALIGTLTVPVMMALVSRTDKSALGAATSLFGMLDPGPVLSGYLGAVLLGALFISFGLFISSFCRDQIMAFVVTAPTLFFAYILGLTPVKTVLNSALAFAGDEWGVWLGDFVGIFSHYDDLTRGVVDGADISFFVVWTAIFLVLNGLGIERRSRKGANALFATAIALLAAIGLATSWLFMDESFGRADLTQDKVYTIDPVSVKVLQGLKADVLQMRYYVSHRDKMPPELQNLQRDVRDKLETLRLASGNRLRYKIVELEPSNALSNPFDEEKKDDNNKKNSLEKRLLKKVQPFQVQVPQGDKITSQLIYSSLEINYQEKESEVIPTIMPNDLSLLEYKLVNKVYRLTREKKPVIALVAPKSELNPQMMALYQQMGRPVPPANDPYEHLQYLLERESNYDVERVGFDKSSPLPKEYDVLAVVNPKDLNDRQRWELERALAAGRKVFLAVQNCTWEYRIHQGGAFSASRQEEKPGVNEALSGYGVGVMDESLMDPQQPAIEIPTPTAMGFSIPQPWPLPLHSQLEASCANANHPITRKLEGFTYLWGSPLRLDEEAIKRNNLKLTRLLDSNDGCWLRTTGQNLTREDIEAPKDAKKRGRYPLAVLLEGQFPDLTAGKERPEWPAPAQNPGMMPPPEQPDEPAGELKPAPGQLVLVGSSAAFQRNFTRLPEWEFFRNSIDYLALDDIGRQIMALRYKAARNRTIGHLDDSEATVWKVVHMIGIYAVIAAVGIVIFVLRRRRREAYAARFK